MSPRAEGFRGRLAGRAILAAIALLVAIPAYLTLDRSWRPLAVRLACALLVIAGAARARRWVREALAASDDSPIDAPPAAPPAPEMDARFMALRDDVIASARSRRYFDVVLWPRLLDLAGEELPRPPARRALRWLGPSLSTLSAVIGRIERRA
jgi:hypothetical protein